MSAVLQAETEPELASVWRWYAVQRDLIADEKTRVRTVLAGAAPVPLIPPLSARYFAMTREELEIFFAEQRTKLDVVVMLDLLSTAEAALRIDFQSRVKQRRRDAVSRQFRDLAKKHGDRIRLEHILQTWKKHAPATKTAVGDFKGVLRLRDWLAHGRHWTPKLGRSYTPADVFDNADWLLKSISSVQPD